MSNMQKINLCDHKPFEQMTTEERDAYFINFFGKTYDEFVKDAEKHKTEPRDISHLIKN